MQRYTDTCSDVHVSATKVPRQLTFEDTLRKWLGRPWRLPLSTVVQTTVHEYTLSTEQDHNLPTPAWYTGQRVKHTTSPPSADIGVHRDAIPVLILRSIPLLTSQAQANYLLDTSWLYLASLRTLDTCNSWGLSCHAITSPYL